MGKKPSDENESKEQTQTGTATFELTEDGDLLPLKKNKKPKADSKAVPADPESDTDTMSAGESSEKAAEAEKKYLYLAAEFDNYKKQAIKERSQLLRFGAERLALDLLETLDVFESALNGEVNEENYKDFLQGIQLTHQQLQSALEKHGIKRVECLGDAFNPSMHEALSSEPTDQYPPGHISNVFKSPYTYHDKLLRAGQVVVAKEAEKKD